MIRCREHVFDPQDLSDVMKKSRGELLAIIRQEHERRAMSHNQRCGERFYYTFGRDSPKRNQTDEFWETVRYDQESLVIPWSGHKFPQDVNGNKLV